MEVGRLMVVSIALSVVLFHQVSYGFELDLTTEINAGAIDCFWQHFKGQTTVELEYQVIDGGELDIDFSLKDPNGRVVHLDQRKTENVVRFHADRDGEHQFCFDNTFSRMSPKVVFFEIIADEDSDDDREDDDDGDDWKVDAEEVRDMVDMTLEDLKGIIDRSKSNLDKSIQLQNLIKIHEARDRNIAEANFSRVNVLSAVQLFVMITVGLTQVLMIRSLFQDKHTKTGLKAQT